MATSIMSVADLQRLLEILREQGYDIIGPTIREGAVFYDHLQSTAQLPQGYIEAQDGGTYRLKATDTKSLFAYTMGPNSWKTFLYPPHQELFKAHAEGRRFSISSEQPAPPPMAFLGVRACELAAIAILDKIMLEGPYQSLSYRKRRENTFIIAVNCTRAGDTCFCASMNTGPRVLSGYDLRLTEMCENGEAVLLAESGSKRGQRLLTDMVLAEASEAQMRAANAGVERAANAMGRTLDTGELPVILKNALDDSHWEEIASRCLSCGNCTMVCPTCFCGNTEDTTDLAGSTAYRMFLWDSCHTAEFSYIHGGSIRSSVMSRYRQWMMHKLVYWPEQFATFGCVGCGRCITWCPVGIDITKEASVFREKALR